MDKVNLAEKLGLIHAHWQPKIVAEFNDHYVKLAKAQGEFLWHHHEDEDEVFLVLAGRLLLRFRDRDLWLEPGELAVVPRGVEHLPVAPEEAHILLLDPRTVLNTGTERTERTAADEWI